MTEPTSGGRRPPFSRRSLLVGGAAGAALGAGTWAAARGLDPSKQPTTEPVPATYAQQTVTFHGTHQPGVTTLPAQAHAMFLALDLRPGVDRAQWCGCCGCSPTTPSDSWPAAAAGVRGRRAAARPARLTVTVGFGPGLFDAIGRPGVPRGGPRLADVRHRPAGASWSGGDVVLQVCSDEPTTAVVRHPMAGTGRPPLRDGALGPARLHPRPRDRAGRHDNAQPHGHARRVGQPPRRPVSTRPCGTPGQGG